MTLQPVPEGPLRTGYTTGACATACAKAALQSLLEQKQVREVEISLPAGEKVTFVIKVCVFDHNSARCSTVKDAGDDPDVTHGAEIGCVVSLNDERVVKFTRGEGVGVVTLPGLSLAVGEPAINPVPRKMMIDETSKVLRKFNMAKGVNIEVYIVNGRELAKKTLNARVGILDGLSILGTTGIVTPFSASAYIASIAQGIDVAVANGCSEIVINSGGKTEKLLRKQFLHLPEYAFIQYGNWIGETLDKIRASALVKVTMGIMLGKAVKLAQGELDTHSSKSVWDKAFVYRLALSCGYSEENCQKVLSLHMARRLTEVFPFTENEVFYRKLGEECLRVCREKIPEVKLELLLINTEDQIIWIR